MHFAELNTNAFFEPAFHLIYQWISSISIWRGGLYLCMSDPERQNGFINKFMSLLSGSKEENRVMNDSTKI
jgi:hypothetical protein